MSKTIKMTSVAVAVSAVLVSGAVTASKLDKYNFENQKPFATKYATVNAEDLAQATTWLVKLNTPGTAEQRVAFGEARAKVQQAQQSVEASIFAQDLNLEVVAKTSTLVNSIVVKGDKQQVEKLLGHGQVADIIPVFDYELHVAESADYIKATPLVEAAITSGKGIKVAVLDTGVDYTHKALGGSGLVEDYQAAVADPADTPAWPQGKVVGGYDFINNDPDPIDVNTNHGTHVSHSVSGIAPDVEFYVYSVCQRTCPGLAQLNALEAAMDPNGDGDISDRVDVINMSLGGDFGRVKAGAVQEFIDKAVQLGTTVVISAGNDGPTPFIVGGPSTTANALSVGAMTHPTIKAAHLVGSIFGEAQEINASSFNPEKEFSASSEAFPLVFVATGANAQGEDASTACEPFADSVDFTGKAVLVDRGGCTFVSKVLNAQARGAAFVFIANNAPGAGATAPGGSGDGLEIPSVGISYELGQKIKAALANGEAIDYSITSELKSQAGAIASFTSRGPSLDGLLKPEITAPGVSIMTAHPGLGDGLTPASGTSFSGPITAGAMSMVREALPERTALEAKATLMNTANLDVTMEPRSINPDAALAPISYIGAGLVDVEKAVNLPVAAWAKDTKQAALSFGLVTLAQPTTYTKTVQVKNFSNSAKTYTLSHDVRFADDAERGALAMAYPESITVPAGQTFSFDVTATIDPSKLPEWTLEASDMYKPEKTTDLTTSELDGALYFSENGEKAFHLVYHVLPKANASVEIKPTRTAEGATQHVLTNTGAVALEPFFAPTVAQDEAGDASEMDLIAGSIETFPVSAEWCKSGYMTMTTFVVDKPFIHTYQAGFMADIDFNPVEGEESYDYTIQNGTMAWFDANAASGIQISFTHPYGKTSGAINSIFFTAANNHVSIPACIEALGLTAEQVMTGVPAKVRFRTESGLWKPIPSSSLDQAFGETTFKVAPAARAADESTEVAVLVDADGNEVESLAPGASAILKFKNENFVLLSDTGAQPVVATPAADQTQAPIVNAGQVYSVEENSATGTVVGQVAVSYASSLARPVSEYIVTSSTSTAVTVDKHGQVVVADAELLNYDAGLTTIELEVVAADTAGNVSEPALVVVNVLNLADEPIEQPAPVVAADQTFSVDENTATGTEIGAVAFTTTNPIGSFVVKASSSEALTVTAEGKVVVADSTKLDYDAGVKSVELTVVAVDTAGLESEAVVVTVTVKNLADETSETAQPFKPVKKSSSGSLFWLLLAAPLALFRRKK